MKKLFGMFAVALLLFDSAQAQSISNWLAFPIYGSVTVSNCLNWHTNNASGTTPSVADSGAPCGQALDPAAYYVATTGSDSNAGTFSAPFLTLAHAQTVMETSGNWKTVYVRAGTYSNTALTFTQADNGQTWSYFPGDGYNTAIIDGGASSGSTGGNPVTMRGTSNITFNGLAFNHCQQWCIGFHGGASTGTFPQNDPTSDKVSVTNSTFQNIYTSGTGWAGGAVFGYGQVTNVLIDHNACQFANGACYRVSGNGDSTTPNDRFSGLTITSNVCLNANQTTGDSGCIYTQDPLGYSTNVRFANNFIRDYQCNTSTGCNANNPPRDVGIYLDLGSSNVDVLGNLIANTSNATGGSSGITSTAAFFCGNCRNTNFVGNLIDLGTTGFICDLEWNNAGSTRPNSVNVLISGNVFVGNWTGAQACYSAASGPFAYPGGHGTTTQSGSNTSVPNVPVVTNNMYYNYGSGSLSTTGTYFSDASATTATNPLVGADTLYTISTNSPAYATATGFGGITGKYGPPGYVVPAGTAPSP